MRRRPLSKHLRVQVLARDGYHCLMCGRSKDEVALEVDHLVAVANGGTDELHNLATLCRDCNAGKSNYHFSDYRSISVIPKDLRKHIVYFTDDKTGDSQHYHAYVYYRDLTKPGSSEGKLHRSWKLSRSQYAVSPDPHALESRRREEESLALLLGIRQELIAQGERLIENEAGLQRVDG